MKRRQYKGKLEETIPNLTADIQKIKLNPFIGRCYRVWVDGVCICDKDWNKLRPSHVDDH